MIQHPEKCKHRQINAAQVYNLVYFSGKNYVFYYSEKANRNCNTSKSAKATGMPPLPRILRVWKPGNLDEMVKDIKFTACMLSNCPA